MEKLLRQICPELTNDRVVRATMSRESWYKVVGNVLYVPPEGYLKTSPIEVDRFCESIKAFAYLDLTKLAEGDSRWKVPYTLYTLEADCIKIIRQLNDEQPNKIVCDIECSHTGWYDNNMLLIGFKIAGCFHAHLIACFTPNVCSELQKLYENTHKTFVWHNGKFDIGRIHFTLGVRARVDEDTMLLHYVGINERKGTHGLKLLAPLYLQAPDWDAELQDFKKKYARANRIKLDDFVFDKIPIDVLCPYNAMDLYATELLLETFQKIIRPDVQMIYRTLVEASNVYAEIEETGFMVDENYLNLLHIELQEECTNAEDVMETIAAKYWDARRYAHDTGAKYPGAYFNHKSPKQLTWLLEQVLGQKVTSTNADTLDALFEENPNQDFLKALMSLRTLNKKLDTYVTGIRSFICPDGRIRPSFNLHGTETGRLSCSDPNLQNIPRDPKIKNIFKAAPGKILVNLDYSQAELRVLAYLSQDPWLIDLFKRGDDLHNQVALAMFGEGFTKEQRVQAKTINFGIAYGRGAGSLRDDFGISMTEAVGLINKWFQPMPKVKKWINETRLLPMRGDACKSPFGRERHFVVTNTNRNAIQNESVNFPISSTATDLTLMSLLTISKAIKNSAYSAFIHIINTVHDSIVFEVEDKKEVIDWLVKTGITIMRETPIALLGDRVPFKADAEIGYTWGSMKAYELI
ncbi:MAG: DNA polymerase I, thermostable [Bacteroidetes bacterium ADurb.Bin302]|nr:MAG: DNA polymerase I, thermostable [Bacteroidetes bacterium ADurb.Bin302]